MVRQLQPWFENVAKRQVKAPKLYLRDSGLLHTLLTLSTRHDLMGHPGVGASWEGFALEQVLRVLQPPAAYFWSTHGAAELDLFFLSHGRHFGVEFKRQEAPRLTPSMRIAKDDLRLDHLWVIYPGSERYPLADGVTVWPLRDVTALSGELSRRAQPGLAE